LISDGQNWFLNIRDELRHPICACDLSTCIVYIRIILLNVYWRLGDDAATAVSISHRLVPGTITLLQHTVAVVMKTHVQPMTF
jgi:hypothetical protein